MSATANNNKHRQPQPSSSQQNNYNNTDSPLLLRYRKATEGEKAPNGNDITGKRDDIREEENMKSPLQYPSLKKKYPAAGDVSSQKATSTSGGTSRSTSLLEGYTACKPTNNGQSDKHGDAPLLSIGSIVGDPHHQPSTGEETSWTILFQVAFPFIVAGCGMVGAGLVLDIVQHWRVFTQVPEIFILVPALLGLKGNLEMTLAARLSTMANLGKMDTRSEQSSLVYSNLALIQVQAIVVAFLASAFAIILAWIPKGEANWSHAVLLCASSLTTASLASLILGVIMVAVVLGARHFHINPDNVATPIAASLGDLITLAVLAGFGTVFLDAKMTAPWLNWLVVAGWLVGTPLWCWVAWQNPSTRNVLKTGWTPVILAMLISSAGGFILKAAVERFDGIAVFQPVINGIGGNLVAVQASRLSTSLHRHAGKLGSRIPDSLPPPRFFQNPARVFLASDGVGRASRVLLLMVVPGHLIFMYMIHFIQAGHTAITISFAVGYVSAAFIQVSILLWICVGMVIWMWKHENDPDNFAIPYLTALGDLLGTALLAIAFSIVFQL